MVTRKLMTTLNNNREEYFCFHPLLCLLLQIQMNPDSLLTPDFYTLLYVSTAVDNLFLTDQPDSIYKSDAFYRHVDEKAGASGKRFHVWEKGWAGGVRGHTETFGASGLWQ